jgi:hypothetical protein
VDYRGLHNGAKSLIITDVTMLREPVKNLASFVPLECPVGLELVLEYPLISDNIGSARVQNQVPSTVGHERDVLLLHSHPPMRIGKGGPN